MRATASWPAATECTPHESARPAHRRWRVRGAFERARVAQPAKTPATTPPTLRARASPRIRREEWRRPAPRPSLCTTPSAGSRRTAPSTAARVARAPAPTTPPHTSFAAQSPCRLRSRADRRERPGTATRRTHATTRCYLPDHSATISARTPPLSSLLWEPARSPWPRCRRAGTAERRRRVR